MTMEFKAIETKFDGYHFRSRLEARWGVFFKTLGIEYRYENEGYDLDGILYLPDFYLPQLNSFIEIKPTTPTRSEREKAIKLCMAKHCPVFILAGDAWSDVEGHAFAPITLSKEIFKHLEEDVENKRYSVHWISTNECVVIDTERREPIIIDFDTCVGWTSAYWVECDTCQGIGLYSGLHHGCTCGESTFKTNTPVLLEAFTAARQARFERGAKS